jgi:O-antigen/teichoic acid export membrane protein
MRTPEVTVRRRGLLGPRTRGEEGDPVVRERLPAVAAQFTQALTSLALGLIAVRVLDATGFGRYSLIISTLLVMTGLSTGLIGDSLTVLDRHQRQVRYALQVTALATATACALLVAVGGIGFGWFPAGTAPVVALAVLSFLLEDVLRRALMANSRFVAVLVVDLTYAVAAGVILLSAWQMDQLGLIGIFLAMTVGQCLAGVVAVVLLPRSDRYLARRGSGGLQPVLAFGGWRAAQGVIGPVRLWAARMLVAAAVGLAAVGTLEANRILVAPVMLAVQGLGSAMLVSYSRTFRASPTTLARTADRDALVLVAGSLAAVAAILLSAPLLGRVLLGSTELVNRPAIFGWGLVAVGIAAALPFTNVTSIAGAPHSVVGIRMIDLTLSLLGVSALLMLTDADLTYVWTPTVLGLVVCATALVQRRRSRRQMSRLADHPGALGAQTEGVETHSGTGIAADPDDR